MGLREEGLPRWRGWEPGLLGAGFPARALGCHAILVSPMLPAHILQVVVEVDGTGTQIAPQQCGMGSEDGCHRQAPGTAQTQTNACQPLMEVGNNIGLLFVLGQELWGNKDRATVSTCHRRNQQSPTWTGKQGRGDRHAHSREPSHRQGTKPHIRPTSQPCPQKLMGICLFAND